MKRQSQIKYIIIVTIYVESANWREKVWYTAMGILNLSKLIADVAPMAIKEGEIKNYFGKMWMKKNLFEIYKLYCFRPQNRNRCLYVFIPIPHCRALRRWPANIRRRRDNLSSPWHLLPHNSPH